jgi:beta-phosphoglucomutase-like phosphatase (HAD superfamily)
MAVEDSRNGVQSALGADISSILVTTNGYTAQDDFSGASLVVDRMGEPDEPFQVQMGDAYGHDYVNLQLLRALHGDVL